MGGCIPDRSTGCFCTDVERFSDGLKRDEQATLEAFLHTRSRYLPQQLRAEPLATSVEDFGSGLRYMDLGTSPGSIHPSFLLLSSIHSSPFRLRAPPSPLLLGVDLPCSLQRNWRWVICFHCRHCPRSSPPTSWTTMAPSTPHLLLPKSSESELRTVSATLRYFFKQKQIK
jgi:hypothetical protein